LARHGITIVAGIVDGDALATPLSYGANLEILVDSSPPLVEIVDVAMKWSRNIYAESLLFALAAEDAVVTSRRAMTQMSETLESWGVGEDGFLARDGSGLSRYNYVTADALVTVLRRMLADERHAAPFRSVLPVGGESGTLADRMKGTIAAGRVRAKTGTLSNVRSLGGYTETIDGDTVVFAMLANNFAVPARDIDALMERALAHVIAFTAPRSVQRPAPATSRRLPPRAPRRIPPQMAVHPLR
jgi:D-alanyl-D-alanine carboxypeptidase/D-alanyl-D-alanine-endopeptidase (penicillin-binding protein 4)